VITTTVRLKGSTVGADLINALDRHRRTPKGAPSVVTLMPCNHEETISTVALELLESARTLQRSILLVDVSSTKARESDDLGLPSVTIEELTTGMTPLIVPPECVTHARPGASFQEGSAFSLGVEHVRGIVARAERYEYVVFVTRSIFLSSLADLIASEADQSYLVVQQDQTTITQLNLSLARFTDHGREPTGVIYTNRRHLIPDFVYRLFFPKR
jgi:hypothetical protein